MALAGYGVTSAMIAQGKYDEAHRYAVETLALTKAVIGLARAFGREVIAEGLETLEHGQLLMRMGCEVAQGYFIARPLPADDVPGWVEGFAPPPQWQKLE